MPKIEPIKTINFNSTAEEVLEARHREIEARDEFMLLSNIVAMTPDEHQASHSRIMNLHDWIMSDDEFQELITNFRAQSRVTATEIQRQKLEQESLLAAGYEVMCFGQCQPQKPRKHVDSRVVEPKMLETVK